MAERQTIFAVSSGLPPAAIAIIRISGPAAAAALATLTRGAMPTARQAVMRTLWRPDDGNDRPEVLDQALVLWFPGPNTATGEDLVELHLHGGRAVIAAVEAALSTLPDLRRAVPGEFTRRAFTYGRIDLAEAEGLSDLLMAETEWQRQAAIAQASGQFSHQVEHWREQILGFSALVEAELDFSDEDDVSPDITKRLTTGLAELALAIQAVSDRPSASRLQQGIYVVLAGPPNSGKSTLLNALVQRDAAIVSDIAGTTRDVIETAIALGGVPFNFVDTAGLRGDSDDPIEKIGIERAEAMIARADIVLWLGDQGAGPTHHQIWEICPRSDADNAPQKPDAMLSVSAKTGQNMDQLVDRLIGAARDILPPLGEAALNDRQRHHVAEAHRALIAAGQDQDLLIIGEHLRQARRALDGLLGRTHTEDMLDALFGRFCIGK